MADFSEQAKHSAVELNYRKKEIAQEITQLLESQSKGEIEAGTAEVLISSKKAEFRQIEERLQDPAIAGILESMEPSELERIEKNVRMPELPSPPPWGAQHNR